MKMQRTKTRSAAGVSCLLLLLLLLPGKALAAEAGAYFPPCGRDTPSLADALASVGAACGFDYRAEIARANGYRDYQGTAGQNTALLWLLRNGRLRRPETDGGPLERNAGRVAFLHQEPKTCKATAAAMALNLMRGADGLTTADLGGSCCRSLDGEKLTDDRGHTYTGVYKTDLYAGSLSELTEAIDSALDAGIPIVAPVHSTLGGTRHHWVLVLGRRGQDYIIADPARRGSGAIADNAVAMSSRGYAFGLADYETMHYGYVTFVRT